MNKYQKIINQIVKDDMDKDTYVLNGNLPYRFVRKTVRQINKDYSIEDLLDVKEFNKVRLINMETKRLEKLDNFSVE